MKRDRFSGDDGMTVTELVTVTLLLGLVAVLLFSALVSTQSITKRANDNVAAERDALQVLRNISQDVRSANPIRVDANGQPFCGTAGVPHGNCIEVYLSMATSSSAATCATTTNDVSLPFRRISYRLVGSQILESRWDHSTSCSTFTTRYVDRPIASRVVSGGSSSDRLFTFYEKSGTAISGTDITGVAAVRIAYRGRYATRSPVLPFISTVALRNYR